MAEGTCRPSAHFVPLVRDELAATFLMLCSINRANEICRSPDVGFVPLLEQQLQEERVGVPLISSLPAPRAD